MPEDAATSTAIADGSPATTADSASTATADSALTSTATDTATSTTLTDSGTNPSPDADAATISAELPFRDNFDNGYKANWASEVVNGIADPLPSDGSDGANQWVTLDSTASTSGFSRMHCSQQFPYADLSASMALRIEQAPTSTRTARLDVRQSSDSPNVFYAVGATVGTDGSVTKVSLFKKVPDTNNPGNFTICALNDPNALTINPIDMNQWFTIKLTISGTTQVKLSAYYVSDVVGDVLVASYVDDCSSNLQPTDAKALPVANGGCLADQTGLGIQIDKGFVASFDNVLVTSP
jgi:hypothetical protein